MADARSSRAGEIAKTSGRAHRAVPGRAVVAVCEAPAADRRHKFSRCPAAPSTRAGASPSRSRSACSSACRATSGGRARAARSSAAGRGSSRGGRASSSGATSSSPPRSRSPACTRSCGAARRCRRPATCRRRLVVERGSAAFASREWADERRLSHEPATEEAGDAADELEVTLYCASATAPPSSRRRRSADRRRRGEIPRRFRYAFRADGAAIAAARITSCSPRAGVGAPLPIWPTPRRTSTAEPRGGFDAELAKLADHVAETVMLPATDAAKPYCAMTSRAAASRSSSTRRPPFVVRSIVECHLLDLAFDAARSAPIWRRLLAHVHEAGRACSIETDALNRDPLSTVHVAWAARLGGARSLERT